MTVRVTEKLTDDEALAVLDEQIAKTLDEVRAYFADTDLSDERIEQIVARRADQFAAKRAAVVTWIAACRAGTAPPLQGAPSDAVVH